MPYKVNNPGWLKIIMIAYIAVVVGCSQTSNPNVLHNVTPLPSAIPQTPQQGNLTMPLTSQTPNPSGLTNITKKAKDDLAHRLSISTEQINVLEARDVIWSDSSLGCPQAGMVYAQVLTPGYLIRLEYNDQQYEYHAGKSLEVIYCENPTPPFSGNPGNT